ncbi:hypothetical protein [Hazenella coriacea]|uniref:Uncharacterized protein n=1 Tax=Hazenella coriacea TaxID=1179467 RepID=A0A4R3L9I9_9BACL|nr:hypothetical protein [Hazenella coriacea]TCS95888.1 hypothetical protein EDD58_102470 [Hazenella coriacea]
MDAHVSLEALKRFKQLLTRFSTDMRVEAQKMQLHLTKTHQQLEQKHFELKRKLQMCPDQISYERARQELIEFERLFAAFCQAAQECIKGFQQQELMAANRQKAVTTIDRKVGVLKEYLGASGAKNQSETTTVNKEEIKYDERVLRRMKEDVGTHHNFPASFDKPILSNQPAVTRSDGRTEYLHTGKLMDNKEFIILQ